MSASESTKTQKSDSTRSHKSEVQTGISADDRKSLADNLSVVLADTYVLMVKTHVYHWNVVGPLFVPIHTLTEAHYNDLFKAADVIAERIRALGHLAPQSIGSMLPTSSVEEEQRARTAQGMITQLVQDHEAIVRRMRESAGVAEDMEDFVTVDMLTDRLAFHEKAIWMLRAMTGN